MDSNPLISVSYELFFQIFNTVLILSILVFIIYIIFTFCKKLTSKNKYENKIKELENKVNNLENKINDKL